MGRRGDGVLLLARAHLRPFLLPITCDDYDECSIETIKLGCAVHNVVISSVYRPPKTGVAVSDQLVKRIIDIRADVDLFVIVSNFNYTAVDWRHEYTNDWLVYDFVKTFMRILNDCFCRFLPVVRQDLCKPRHIVPKFTRRLILQRNCLWKKVKNEPTRLVYRAAFKNVRLAMRSYVVYIRA